ncbi:hypothetical protein [Psychrobacillus soli]|nr:hypothetical protein [Psychrobacillus soli]
MSLKLLFTVIGELYGDFRMKRFILTYLIVAFSVKKLEGHALLI